MSEFDSVVKEGRDAPKPDEFYGLKGIYFAPVQEKSQMCDFIMEAVTPKTGVLKYIHFAIPAELLGDFAATFLKIKGEWERKKH